MIPQQPALVLTRPLEGAWRVCVVGVRTPEDRQRLVWSLKGGGDEEALRMLLPDYSELVKADPRGMRVVPPGSMYSGLTFREVLRRPRGWRWFSMLLCRMTDDDWPRPQVEDFIRAECLPVWDRYTAWRTATACAELAELARPTLALIRGSKS